MPCIVHSLMAIRCAAWEDMTPYVHTPSGCKGQGAAEFALHTCWRMRAVSEPKTHAELYSCGVLQACFTSCLVFSYSAYYSQFLCAFVASVLHWERVPQVSKMLYTPGWLCRKVTDCGRWQGRSSILEYAAFISVPLRTWYSTHPASRPESWRLINAF
jgi:hypothetical protein